MFNNRIIHEIKFWSQAFTRIVDGRLTIEYRSWHKPQKLYFSKVPDWDSWDDSGWIEND